MTDKQIRKALAEHNLSTKGKTADLIKRHREFVLRYTANLDSANPRPVSEIARETMEFEQKQPAISASFRKQPQTAQTKEDHFSELIKQYYESHGITKEMRLQKRRKVRQRIESPWYSSNPCFCIPR
jgi:hypothetical protein